MANDLYLAELTIYDPSVSGLVTLRYATGQGHVTGGAETPASTWYDGRIAQPCSVKRDIFRSGRTTGRTQIGYGDLVLYNADGALDVLLTYGFSNRSVVIRRGTVGAAYPSGFPAYFSGTMEQVEAVGDTIIVKVRDWQLYLDVPLQVNKYAGNNVLPAGLEGVAGDLLGKPKPLCFGSAQNVPAPCVNTSKLIYQVSDGEVTAISAVYDRGIRLLGDTWAVQTTGFGANSILGIAYGANTWVAVGANRVLQTSPDGITWTTRTSAIATVVDINCIAFGANVFVIGAASTTAATSPDGFTWTARSLGTFPSIPLGVAYGAGLFVMVGLAGSLGTSLDGITWTTRTSGFGATAINGVAFGAGLFVIVGNAGLLSTSPDGVTWTSRTSLFGATNIRRVSYGGGLFVAVGASGTMAISLDGITWTLVTSQFGASSIQGIACSPGRFVAVGVTGIMSTSVNGTSWTLRTSNFGANNMNAIASNPDGYFVAVGDGSTLSLYGIIAGTYGNLTELQDDAQAPAPGSYKTFVSAGYFRLGAAPAGLVTADVSEGAGAAARTSAQVFKRLLQRANYTVSGTLSTDITALDAANSAVIGFWTNEERRLIDVLDEVASTPGAWWGVDNSGTYTIQQLTAPAGTPVLTITANDILQPLQRLASADDSRGLPSWRTVLRYARNYAVQDTDLAAGVADDRRTFLARGWREAISSDATVLVAHQLAPQTAEDSLFYAAADATAEVVRRQVMRGILRNRFQAVVELNDDTDGLDLGDVVALQHSRYSLSAGVNYRIIGLDPDVRAKRVTLTLWGPPDPISLMRLPQLVLAGTGTVTPLSGITMPALRLNGSGTVT